MSSRMLVICFLGLVLVISACSDSKPTKPNELGKWQFLGLKHEGVRSLEWDPPSLYACAGRAGLFRADLSGPNPEWVHLGLSSDSFPLSRYGGLRDLVILDADTLLAALDHYTGNEFYPGLYRSTDGGLSWARSDTGITHRQGYDCAITCLAACGNFVYAGTNECGLYRSEDGGQHWEALLDEVGIGCRERWVEVPPSDCGIVWVAGGCWMGEGMGVSYDYGETWESIGLDFRPVNRFEIALDPVDPTIAYVGMIDSVAASEDRGATFETIFRYPNEGWCSALAHALSSGHVFVAAIVRYGARDSTMTRLYEIKHAGSNIDTVITPFTDAIYDLVHDGERQRLYVATGEGVYLYEY